MPFESFENAPEMYEQPSRDELMELGWLAPEDKEIIPLLIKQGWSPQEAIAAAATLSNSAKPGEARVYKETPGGLQRQYAADMTGMTPDRAAALDQGNRAIEAGMKTLGEPATKFDLTRAKMREGFQALGGAVDTNAAKEMAVKQNEQQAAVKMLREYLITRDAQMAEDEKKRALSEMVHNLRRGLDNIAQARVHGLQLTPDGMNVVNQFPQAQAQAAPQVQSQGVLGPANSTLGPRGR